jgi:hypothetical protein
MYNSCQCVQWSFGWLVSCNRDGDDEPLLFVVVSCPPSRPSWLSFVIGWALDGDGESLLAPLLNNFGLCSSFECVNKLLELFAFHRVCNVVLSTLIKRLLILRIGKPLTTFDSQRMPSPYLDAHNLDPPRSTLQPASSHDAIS